jgi:hypothetical protein
MFSLVYPCIRKYRSRPPEEQQKKGKIKETRKKENRDREKEI